MDDYRIAVGFLDHPKTVKLRRRLGPGAIEVLLRLFEFCASNKDRTTGDLTGMTPEDLAIVVRWEGDADELWDALVGIGFLDVTSCVTTPEPDYASGNPFEPIPQGNQPTRTAHAKQLNGNAKTVELHDWSVHNPFVATHLKRVSAAHKAGVASGKSRRKRSRVSANESAQLERLSESVERVSANGSTSQSKQLNPISNTTSNTTKGAGHIAPDETAPPSARKPAGWLSVKQVASRGESQGWLLLGSKQLGQLRQLCPISPTEWDEALQAVLRASPASPWDYFLGCVGKSRERPPGASGRGVERPANVGHHPGSDWSDKPEGATDVIG